MICSLLNRELGFICRSVVRFLDRSISRAMGCFFGCFRIKDDRSRTHLVSDSRRSKLREPVVSQNRLSSLFLSEEREDSRSNDRENLCLGSPRIDEDLKVEAKFLKACGTLPETPAEIRKASGKLKGSSVYDKDVEPLKFHSWLPNTSIKKLQLDKQPDEPPTPIKLSEEWGRGSGPLEHTPSSSISNVQNTGRISISSTEGSAAGGVNTALKIHPSQNDDLTTSVSPWLSTTDVQRRNKAVRFECDFSVSSSKGSSSEDFSQNSKKSEAPGNKSASKPSPNPTPSKLSDEMQTPGTVFPTNLESLAKGKTRIRSQYVYSVLNPIENASQWKALTEEESGEMGESLEKPEYATPKSEVGAKDTSVGKELKVEASLSSWLKPPPSTHGDINQNASSKNPHFRITPGDRPIIGMVAAHWNEDETSHISPKWWDGNGIPNSTNKYKEDQKVSWHATPFEERLEKALSEESFISQRKHINGTPIAFDETEESDTALSQLRPSTHSKSVVSF